VAGGNAHLALRTTALLSSAALPPRGMAALPVLESATSTQAQATRSVGPISRRNKGQSVAPRRIWQTDGGAGPLIGKN